MKVLCSVICTVTVLLTCAAATHAETQLRYVATIDVRPDWEGCKDLAARGEHLFVGVHSGTGGANDPAALLVYDVSDPSAPGKSPVGAVALPGGVVHEIEVVGGLAYLAHQWFSLVDISDPRAPSLLCYHNQDEPPTPYQTAFLGVAVSGDYAFIADHWQGLRVLDVSAPCPVTEVGGPLGLEYFEHTLEIRGQTAFVPTAHRPHGAWLFAIDISIPSSLAVIGQIPLPLAPVRLVVSDDGQRAYIACMEGGLGIVNIADPENMAQIGSYPLSLTRDVASEEDLVVAADEDTVVALDVADPTTPVFLDSEPLPGLPSRITVEDGLVYVSVPHMGQVVIFSLRGAPPVADAGPDQTVEQESYAGTEVTLDGSGSTDPDSTEGTNDDIVSFDWYEAGVLLGSGEQIEYTFPLGEHTVSLMVTDKRGQTDDDEVIIVVEDTSPPTIHGVSASPDVLWPPNHRMVEIVVEVAAEDICDPEPVCWILGISSNEPINDSGDGDTEPDWEYTNDPLMVLLRAERAGGGSG